MTLVCIQFKSEDEWKEYVEQDLRPDLSNLKLGQLTVGGGSDNNQNSAGNENENENYQADGDSSARPWKLGGGASAAAAPVKTVEPVKNTGAYVPPSLARAEVRTKKSIIPRTQNNPESF